MKDAGLGSLPGTSAEVLDDRVRARIAPGRITTAEWIEVVTTAHAVGLPTTSTIMYGHVETDVERMRHLDLLRSIQRETGGFTEFVPLSFVHEEAPMTLRQQLPELRPGPTGDDVIRLYAIARLDARQHHPEPPGLLGEGRDAAGAVAPLVRRQRLRRHAHQREHLDLGGRRARAAADARGAAARHPRRGARARRAEHALRRAPRLPAASPGPTSATRSTASTTPRPSSGATTASTRDERFRFRLPVAAS